MIAARLLLAAGTAAAAVASVGHGGAAPGPLQVGGQSGTTPLVVPAKAHLLIAHASGSAAVRARTTLTIVRTSDGATLFTGSLATFKALTVVAGTSLRVQVERPARYAELKAADVLRWS